MCTIRIARVDEAGQYRLGGK